MLRDVTSLREYFKECIGEVHLKMESLEEEIAKEREFFFKRAKENKTKIKELEEESVQLERRYIAEKVFTDQWFIKAEVSKLCSKALFKFDHDMKNMRISKEFTEGSLED